MLSNRKIAKVCYEVNKAYCESLGDNSFSSWVDAPIWQKETIRKGIEFHQAKPNAGQEASHESWMKEKEETGWKYGPVKDAEKKEHPCYVPYNELPVDERTKDYIFKALVNTLS